MKTTLVQQAAGSRPRTRPTRSVRVALAGCGTVGGELVRLLRHHEARLAARYGIRFELSTILVRDRERSRPDGLADLITTDVATFLAARAHIVVEAMGGIDPARTIAAATLDAGRRFVSANKALLAAHGPELMQRARAGRGRLDFEGAVGGGIPVLRALREQLDGADVHSVGGVLNGTTNYILTRLADGRSYTDALAEAQALGFAEADPARDISGADAADKLRILAWLAFGVDPADLPVRVQGIGPDPDRLAADAAAAGGVPRLVARAALEGDNVSAAVEPVIVPATSELGQVRGQDNAVVIDTVWNGRVRLVGPGAGGAPTASALLGDMLRAARVPRRPHPDPTVVAVHENAPHPRLLSVLGDRRAADALVRILERANVSPGRVTHAGGSVRVALDAISWTHVDLVTRAARAAGLQPLVTRTELTG